MAKDSGEEYIVSGSVSNHCYIACITGDLSRKQMKEVYDQIISLAEKRDLLGVIFDLNGLAMMDSAAFSILKQVSGALTLMGLKPVWMGIKPGIASSLVDFDADTDDISICRSIEEGVRQIVFGK